MATTPLGSFANLSRYQQAAVQPQANVLDQFVQALNQGISLAQLPQTLQAEAEQRRQQNILNAIKVATAQKQFEELNKTPEQRLAERFQENLIAQSYDRGSGVNLLSPDQLTQEQLSIFEGGVPLATPGALTPQQQIALEEGNVRTNVPLGAPVAPVLTPRGAPTQFSFDPTVPAGIAQQQEDARLASLEATERAKAAGKLPSRLEELRAAAELKGLGTTKNTVLSPNSILIGPNNEILASNPVGSPDKTISVPPGTKVINATTREVIFDNPITPKTGVENVSEDYRTRKSEEILNSIKDLKARVGLNTVGVGATAAGYLPYNTEAADFAADLTALTSQIAFKELAEMRAASKTGGALGQVSDKEGELLKSAIAALSLKQSPPNFTKNLNRIQESIERWDAAKAKHGIQAPPPTSAPAAPTSNVSEEELNAIRATHGLPAQ